MKKKVKTTKELQQKALNKGASLSASDGGQFNASMKKQAAKMPPKMERQPKNEPPEPAKLVLDEGTEDALNAIAESLDGRNESLLAILTDIKEQISKIQFEAAQPVLDWEFDFIRDKSGFLTKLKARGVMDKKLIN